MNPNFTLQYGEFAVAEALHDKLRVSIFIPASAQEKGIDLLAYKYKHGGEKKILTIQVKASRSYSVGSRYTNRLWFNRFEPNESADWFILIGTYAKFPESENTARKEAQWKNIMLAFSNKEMEEFMKEVRQKNTPAKEDKMFGFGFNDDHNIFQTRGYHEERNMNKYLLENRLKEMENFFQ